MAKKKLRLSKKGKLLIIGILSVLVVATAIAAYFLNLSPLVFKEDYVKVEINDSFDAKKNLVEVKNGNIKDVTIDDSKVNYKKLGDYNISYKYKDKKYSVEVTVVDTKKPSFDVLNLDLDVGMKIKASDMATNIQDETKTKVQFKEDYDFSKAGVIDVVVQVIDEGKNVTSKKGTVTLVEDKEKPTINGIDEMSVLLNSKVDYLSGVSASDNRDSNPVISVDDSKVDLKKLGSYKVVYTVTDRSGNKISEERTVTVVEKKDIGTFEQSAEKIVYLTFDDGPSPNTQKILDILDRYNAKATFFVTGTNQEHNNLIKLAADKGHTIGLHTYSHDYKSVYASVDAYFDDLNKVGKMVKDLIGYTPHYIRFPGGGSNTVSRKYCPGIMSTLATEVINRGYQYYDWNGDSTDASGNNVAVSKLIANATSSKANNINILCHDTNAKSTTVAALPAIIENYQARGYRFEAINDNSFVPHQKVNN